MRRFLLLLLAAWPLAARADFINDNGALPGVKTDKFPLAVGADPTKYIAAADYNAVRDALISARNGLLDGAMIGLAPTPSPTAVTTPHSSYYVFVDTSHNLVFSNNGVPQVICTPANGCGGMTIGNPITGVTPGAVLFASATGNLGQDTSYLYYDNTAHQLNVANLRTGATGGSIFYAGASGELSQDNAHLLYNPTNPAIKITQNGLAQGSGSQVGLWLQGQTTTGPGDWDAPFISLTSHHWTGSADQELGWGILNDGTNGLFVLNSALWGYNIDNNGVFTTSTTTGFGTFDGEKLQTSGPAVTIGTSEYGADSWAFRPFNTGPSPSPAPWSCKAHRFIEPGGPDDYVESCGWNVDGSDATNGQLQWTWEQNFYNVSEFYFATSGINGNGATRPLSLDINLANGGTTWSFNGGAVTMRSAPGVSPAFWSWNLGAGAGYVSIDVTGSSTPPLLVTGPACGVPIIRSNGVDVIQNCGVSDPILAYQTHIGQDNTAVRIGDTLYIGEPATNNAAIYFTDAPSATVSGGSMGAFRYHHSSLQMELSVAGGAWDGIASLTAVQVFTNKLEADVYTADENITQYMLVKASTTSGRVKKLVAGDNSSQMIGVAANTATTGNSITVYRRGQPTPLLEDGTDAAPTIAIADDVEPSPTQSGYVHKGSTDIICKALSVGNGSIGHSINCSD